MLPKKLSPLALWPMALPALLLWSAVAGAQSAGSLPPGHPPAPALRPSAAPVPAAALIDLNSASREQLKTLPGIGDAEAQRIVAARPYPSKAKLVAEGVLSSAQFDAIRHRVVAIQKNTPGKTPGAAPKKNEAAAKSPP